MLALARAFVTGAPLSWPTSCRWAWRRSSSTNLPRVLEQARASGVTIVLIEQFVHRALAFADRAVILQRGRIGWEGSSSDAGAEVLARYLSETAAAEAEAS